MAVGASRRYEPDAGARVGRVLGAMRDYGPIGAAVSMAAIHHRDRAALIDDRGPLTFTEIDVRSNAVANAWRRHGLRAGDGVGIVARNHRIPTTTSRSYCRSTSSASSTSTTW